MLSTVYPPGTVLNVIGMHGMGDCLHQRAIIRQLLERYSVYLETSWPLIYWDMPQLRMMARGTTLRTQMKNATREASKFYAKQAPAIAERIKVEYPSAMVRSYGSVLKAMSARVGVPVGDFRLPVRPEWLAKADKVLEPAAQGRPVMLFRPLVERKEWTGGVTRNPRASDYEFLFESIRRDYFVVSVADLVPGLEWMRGKVLPAGLKFHHGELDAETLFGIAARAALIFSAPGFATVLGQALGTPGVTVFGGYETKSSFSSGADYAPWLPIEPQTPCDCWRHDHDCPKDIDSAAAMAKLREFSDSVLSARAEARLADSVA